MAIPPQAGYATVNTINREQNLEAKRPSSALSILAARAFAS
jgi:hypothetical protein